MDEASLAEFGATSAMPAFHGHPPELVASSPDSASVRNLKLTLDNILDGLAALVVVPASIQAELISMTPGFTVCRAADRVVPDAIVLDSVFSWDQAGPAVAAAQERTKAGGTVLIRLQLDPDVPVQREDIMVRFARAFPDFAVRILGLPQPGARASPWVAVSRRLPRALLFMTASSAGKTNTVMDLAIRSGIRAVYGDQVLEGLATGQVDGPKSIQALARAAEATPDWSQAIRGIFDEGHDDAFLSLILRQVVGDDFLFDMWVPLRSRAVVAQYFVERGYFVFQPDADATDTAITNETALISARADAEAASAEVKRLASEAQQALARQDEALRRRKVAARQLKAVEASRSWRLTRPLRALANKVRLLRRPA